MKVVTASQMRSIEAKALSLGLSEDSLMESAGLSIAKRIYRLLQDIKGTRVLVLVGPGNNGGDGMVAARYLADWGTLVTLYMTSSNRREDKLEHCEARRVRKIEGIDDHEQWALNSYLASTDILVDAVLGIGLNRNIEGSVAGILKCVNTVELGTLQTQVVAIDVPSGLNADTGAVDPLTPTADLTLTLGSPKVGLFKFPGAERIGSVEVISVGLPNGLDSEIPLTMINKDLASTLLPKRALNSHKGTFGKLTIVGGSKTFTGAPLLAGVAAYRSGAGLVSLAIPEEIYPIIAAQLPEAIYTPLKSTDGYLSSDSVQKVLNDLNDSRSLVIGPGLGQNKNSEQFIRQLLLDSHAINHQVVLDADALNNLAKIPYWFKNLAHGNVLTPHPGEMARLLGINIEEVQSDRIKLASDASAKWNQVIVLKGAHTVIASPDGRISISPLANPALATAGTGDVLSGIIGAFLCQGMSPYEASVLGTYIHSQCGEIYRSKFGVSGLIASELLQHIPVIMKELDRNK